MNISCQTPEVIRSCLASGMMIGCSCGVVIVGLPDLIGYRYFVYINIYVKCLYACIENGCRVLHARLWKPK